MKIIIGNKHTKKIYARTPNIDLPSYLTADKEYEVIAIARDRESFTILNDEGYESYCLKDGCVHIRGKSWTLTER